MPYLLSSAPRPADEPVFLDRGERITFPILGLGLDDVHVREQDDGLAPVVPL